MKQFTKVKIAKRNDACCDSQYLTFALWEKGEKHRIYINDYKRRTLGYIDLDNNNSVMISDRQGNAQADIDFAVAAFTAEYMA